MNTHFQKKAGRIWTRRSPDGHTKNEIDYIITDQPSMVTDVTVINSINIGSDHMMLMGSFTLNTRAQDYKENHKLDSNQISDSAFGAQWSFCQK